MEKNKVNVKAEFLKMKKQSREEQLNSYADECNKLDNFYQKDPDEWVPTTNDNKESFSIIRLLPPPAGEKSPVRKIVTHWITGPGGTYRELSPTSIALPDPVIDYAKKLKNEGEDASGYWGSTRYWMNIYVLKDKLNPDAEGRVWKYGMPFKLFQKVQEKMNPKFVDDPKVNVFNFHEGTNLKLKTHKVGGYINYDELSEFMAPSEFLDGDDEKLLEVYEALFPLEPLHDPKRFSAYEELQKKFNAVMGISSKSAPKATTLAEDEIPDFEDDDLEDDNVPAKKKSSGTGKSAKKAPVEEDDDEEEEEVKPPVKKSSSSNKPVKKSAVLDDDDEDEAPSKPVKKSSAPSKKPTSGKKAPVVEEDDDEEDDTELSDEDKDLFSDIGEDAEDE